MAEKELKSIKFPGLEGVYVVPEGGGGGATGPAGKDGITPNIGANGNWYLGDIDTQKPSRGEKGADGAAGKDGSDGYSPEATVTPINGGAKIIIKNRNGTTSANVMNGAQGPKGDKGDPGATDLSLGISGAAIGQIAKITAVDEKGVPTKWAPVDMAGGEKPWRKVIDAEVTEPTGAFIADNLNGATELHVRWSGLQNNSDIDSGLKLVVNGTAIGEFGVPAPVPKKGKTTYGWTHFKFDGLFWLVLRSNGSISSSNKAISIANTVYNIAENVGAADTVRLEGSAAEYYPISGKLEVWAR
jgi:hypothetical protein